MYMLAPETSGDTGRAPADGIDVEQPARPYEVFIVGRHDFSVDGLMHLLAHYSDDYLVTCVEPSAECRQKFVRAQPEVLLLHYAVLQEPLEAFVEDLRRDNPQVRILIFGQAMDEEFLCRAVCAGVDGYINERMTGEHLLQAMHAVREGELWVERHLLDRLLRGQGVGSRAAAVREDVSRRLESLAGRLTPRETQVLAKALEGLEIKEIAESIHLSHQGVKVHLGKLFQKFSVRNRTQLVLAVLRSLSPVEDLDRLIAEGLAAGATGRDDARRSA